jgi:hypothetical protein
MLKASLADVQSKQLQTTQRFMFFQEHQVIQVLEGTRATSSADQASMSHSLQEELLRHLTLMEK